MLQLCRFALTGNSFGYNQIRKMISSVVEVAALGGSVEILKQSFDPKLKKHNNNAPSQGLMLWSANFDNYNAKT
jgi:tRNA pseudouridine(38-40) synthase